LNHLKTTAKKMQLDYTKYPGFGYRYRIRQVVPGTH